MRILNENVSRNIMNRLNEGIDDSNIENILNDYTKRIEFRLGVPFTKKEFSDLKREFISKIYEELRKNNEGVWYDEVSRKYSRKLTNIAQELGIKFKDGRTPDNYSTPDDDPKGGMQYN